MTGARRAAFCAAFLAVAATTACRKEPAITPAGDASVGPDAPRAEASSPSSPTSGARQATTPKLPCRAISLSGKVEALLAGTSAVDGGAPLLYPNADIPASAWLALPEGAKLTAKDPRSTRETTFVGPARVRACVHDDEESWVAAGGFESAPGAGETLGGEEWLVSALGAVRYASAGLTLFVSTVNPTTPKVTLRVDRGTAYLIPAFDAQMSRWMARQPEGASAGAGDGGPRADAGADGAAGTDADGATGEGAWTRIDAPSEVVLTFAPAPAQANAPPLLARATAAASTCARAADRAHAVAAKLAAPDAAVGPLTAQHVVERRLARAACAIAELRALALPHADQGHLPDDVRDATARWKSAAP